MTTKLILRIRSYEGTDSRCLWLMERTGTTSHLLLYGVLLPERAERVIATLAAAGVSVERETAPYSLPADTETA